MLEVFLTMGFNFYDGDSLVEKLSFATCLMQLHMSHVTFFSCIKQIAKDNFFLNDYICNKVK